MGTLWRDLCYGIRMLSKKPGFTVVAILSLAIGKYTEACNQTGNDPDITGHCHRPGWRVCFDASHEQPAFRRQRHRPLHVWRNRPAAGRYSPVVELYPCSPRGKGRPDDRAQVRVSNILILDLRHDFSDASGSGRVTANGRFQTVAHD